MCCRRRNGYAYRRRAPLVVVLGKLAYDKYQERNANKALAPPLANNQAIGRSSSPPPEFLENNANAEIMFKAGIQPPSYDVVVNRAEVPETFLQDFKGLRVVEAGTASESESEDERVADGRFRDASQQERALVPAGAGLFVKQRRGCCGRRDGEPSRCQVWKAERAQKKAQKAMAKAERLSGQLRA